MGYTITIYNTALGQVSLAMYLHCCSLMGLTSNGTTLKHFPCYLADIGFSIITFLL